MTKYLLNLTKSKNKILVYCYVTLVVLCFSFGAKYFFSDISKIPFSKMLLNGFFYGTLANLGLIIMTFKVSLKFKKSTICLSIIAFIINPMILYMPSSAFYGTNRWIFENLLPYLSYAFVFYLMISFNHTQFLLSKESGHEN